MLFLNNSTSLFEAAGEVLSSAELLDKEDSAVVKDVVKELEDALTTNVEEVPAKDKESTGATEMLKPTSESCMIFENKNSENYMLNLFDLVRICEAEEDETDEEPGEVDAADKAGEVADAAGVSTDDLVIVAPIDTAEEIVQNAANEAAVGIRNGRSFRRLVRVNEAVKSLIRNDFTVQKI